MARLIFAGTPDFAVPSLRRLIASHHDVVAVLTQPDRPSGRGRRLATGPVKRCALHHDLTVWQPVGLRDPDTLAQLAGAAPDLMVIVAYGLLLPPAVLALPAAGCVNVHASVLPRWRGASPIQAAILAGDRQTGVSIMRMAEGLDTGPVFAVEHTDIGAHETAGELHDRLAKLGADLLMDCLDAILDGRVTPDSQPGAGATYAPRISKSDASIDWTKPAVHIDRQVRAYNPWPVADTVLGGRRMRCWRSVVLEENTPSAPPACAGYVEAAGNDGIDVRTGRGLLRIAELQMPGRRRVKAGEFARGNAVVGKVLGS